jgi:hypothetical protein
MRPTGGRRPCGLAPSPTHQAALQACPTGYNASERRREGAVPYTGYHQQGDSTLRPIFMTRQRCYNRQCKLPATYTCEGCGRFCCPLDSELVRWCEITKAGTMVWHESYLCLRCLRQKLKGDPAGGKEWLSTPLKIKRQARQQLTRG